MSTLDDDLTGIAPARGSSAPLVDDPAGAPDRRETETPKRLLQVRCGGCDRRFSTDVGLCPWCGHASSVAVVSEPSAPAPSPPTTTVRRRPRPPMNWAIVGGAVGGTLLVVALGLWVVAGRPSTSAAVRPPKSVPVVSGSAPGASAAGPVATTRAPSVAPGPTTAATAASTAPTTTAGTTATATATDASFAVVEAYARAMTGRDWAAAGALIPVVKATPADYAMLYGALQSVSVTPLRTFTASVAGVREVYVGQVLVESTAGVTASRLVCAHYTVDLAAGVIRALAATDLATVPGVAGIDAVRDRFAICPAS